MESVKELQIRQRFSIPVCIRIIWTDFNRLWQKSQLLSFCCDSEGQRIYLGAQIMLIWSGECIWQLQTTADCDGVDGDRSLLTWLCKGKKPFVISLCVCPYIVVDIPPAIRWFVDFLLLLVLDIGVMLKFLNHACVWERQRDQRSLFRNCIRMQWELLKCS